MSGATKVSVVLPDLMQQVETAVELIAGERMAIVLIVAPFNELGASNYISNASAVGMRSVIRELNDHFLAGNPDVPLHKKN